MHIKTQGAFLPEEKGSTTPPTAAFGELQLGAAIGKKKAELLRGSQIIFGLEQMVEKGKGCVCERESSKAGREKVKGERGVLLGNKGRQKYVGGWTHIKRGSFGWKIILVLFLEASIIYMRVYEHVHIPACDITHAERRVNEAQRKVTIPNPNQESSVVSPGLVMPAL